MLPAELHARLLDAYGNQNWWPAESEFELLVGAILVQNTRWSNVERAISNLSEKGFLEPAVLLQRPESELSDCIRPAGFQVIKSRRLKVIAKWFKNERPALENVETTILRKQLLNLEGVGPETADVLLLYMFGRPVPIADGYSRRIISRLGMLDPLYSGRYEKARQQMQWMGELSVSVLSELHALLIEHGKQRCRKLPVCTGCALALTCSYPPD